jgi:hypothetical protein
MSEPFDPYRKWLGIPPKDQPPNHYRLLGVAHFEDDPDVIENAATRQMAHVRTYQSGRHSALSQKVLNELTAAKLCLLTPGKKQPYDDQLREKLAAEGKLSSDNLLTPPEVIEDPEDFKQQRAIEPPTARRPLETRWRMETDSPSIPEPPLVPIPMPVGIAVAPQAPPTVPPPFPVATAAPLVRAPSIRYGYRKKSSSAALPIAILLLCLLGLIGGGIGAVLYSGVLGKPVEKHLLKKTATTPAVGPNSEGNGSRP